jgi:hypothetical protein
LRAACSAAGPARQLGRLAQASFPAARGWLGRSASGGPKWPGVRRAGRPAKAAARRGAYKRRDAEELPVGGGAAGTRRGWRAWGGAWSERLVA